MASATSGTTGGGGGAARQRGHSEEEPLLGGQGDASQAEGERLVNNLWIGTAPIAQAGIWIVSF